MRFPIRPFPEYGGDHVRGSPVVVTCRSRETDGAMLKGIPLPGLVRSCVTGPLERLSLALADCILLA